MMRLDVEDWLERYGRAWSERDPDAAARLFSETATYHETPFDPPAVGRDAIRLYWADVPLTQADISFRGRILAVAGQTAIAAWKATFTRRHTGAQVELDGIFLLRFDDRGLCDELREWWHRRETPAPSENETNDRGDSSAGTRPP
jgi:hypothetical protein